MNQSPASRSHTFPEEILAVRRWARTNLWAVLIVAGLSLVAGFLIAPSAVDEALDWLFLATGPVVGVLELLLLVALLRLFKDRDLMLAASMLVAGLASIVAGLLATVLSLTAQSTMEGPASAAGLVLTGAELFLLAALLRRASAEPERLWLWGVAAGVGTVAATVATTGQDALVVITGVLLLAFPVFLYRLGQLRLPATEPLR